MIETNGGTVKNLSALRRFAALFLLPGLAALAYAHDGDDDDRGRDRSLRDVRIEVLSNRADLISGGDALVEIKWPAAALAQKAKIELNGVDVKGAFAMRANGRYMGLVTGLKNGKNVLTVRIGDAGAQIAIKNHPIGGPVFAGAQLQPWICATVVSKVVTVTGNDGQTATATTRASGLNSDPFDAQCNTPTVYFYYYQPKSKEGTACTFTLSGADPCFLPYPVLGDPATRPANADIANFTNDRGATVKSLIRVERGVLNRNIFQLVTFYDPLDANVAWAPAKGWNGKLHWKFGAGASTSRFMEPPGVNTIFDQNALRRGFMVASSHLTNNGSNTNNTLAAETVMMVKERIIERYGQIRYTMADGCSGGSIMQDSISSAYPGLVDGIQPTCVYQDMITSWIEVADCGLLQATVAQASPGGYYFRAGSPGLLLTDAQRTAINGNIPGFCNAWTGSFLNASNPGVTNPITGANNCGTGFPAALVYNAATNPKGVRCDTYDHDAGLVGTYVDPADGVTKANVPRDNVGLQYGLKALQTGVLSAEEFVQLNEGVGGYNADRVWSPNRMAADPAVLRMYYRSGLVSDGRQWAKVPIINLRGNNNPAGDIHGNWRAWGQRDRLDRDHGSHANQVIWGSEGGITPGVAVIEKAFVTMDKWLASIESDPSHRRIEEKVVNNKPGEAVDLCLTTHGDTQAQVDAPIALTDPACPVKYRESPRQAAGGTQAENIFKCNLKPFNPGSADYNGVVFSAGQQARLRAVFPEGVCDWSQRGVGQVPVKPWTSFAAGPGGVPLGDPPVSDEIGRHEHDKDKHDDDDHDD